MRIHRIDLEREIEKARHARDSLVGRRNEIDNALDAKQGYARGLKAARLEIEADLEEIEDYLEIIEDPDILEPCSSAARAAGCTCQMWSVNPTDIDPPEAIRSRSCPLHGSDNPEWEHEP